MLNFMMGRGMAASGPQMSPQDAVSRAANDEIHVIDVREHNEIAMTGKAAGAIHIPLAALRSQADPNSPSLHPSLKQGKPIAVYCASGSRSGMAARLLMSLGHSEVHNIGGLGHWHMAGGQIER